MKIPVITEELKNRIRREDLDSRLMNLCMKRRTRHRKTMTCILIPNHTGECSFAHKRSLECYTTSETRIVVTGVVGSEPVRSFLPRHTQRKKYLKHRFHEFLLVIYKRALAASSVPVVLVCQPVIQKFLYITKRNPKTGTSVLVSMEPEESWYAASPRHTHEQKFVDFTKGRPIVEKFFSIGEFKTAKRQKVET